MNNSDNRVWHRETITATSEETLRLLRDTSLLSGFYLAGGTALALHFGHRISQDLDFFAQDLFDEEILLQRLQRLPAFSLVSRAPHTLHTNVQATKVSFLSYAYPRLYPLFSFLDVPIADPRDIACMKISAIASRGTKRDFVDLYMAGKQFGMSALLDLFRQKFSQTRYNTFHILKSFTYFADAEKDSMPHMLVPTTWEEAVFYS